MMIDPKVSMGLSASPGPSPTVLAGGQSVGAAEGGEAGGLPGSLESVAVFCGNCSCGCPELFVDHAADEERRVVITDDFGQRVQMSLVQLSALVADVKSGALDRLLA